MSVIEWRSEFGIGIEIADHDHQQLIGRIRGHQQMLATCTDPDEMVAVLDQIYTDIASHFALEEKLMEQMRYAALADHKEDHETLLDDLREIMVGVGDDGELDEVQLTDDLDRWFSDHFRTHDAKLHRAT
ncbi:MAG: hemerythrin domain-containing protein [Woeseiaceae bacterium]|nr:hemerythrin domain-containing protein [Woeseiaceae bacterium]